MPEVSASPPPAPRAGGRRAVLALVVVLPLLALVPNLSGWLLSDPPGAIFLGFRHMPKDHHQYAMFVAQAREDGAFFMRDLLTSEPHPGRFMALYPWLVGRFAAATGLGDAEAWLLLQYPVGALALLATWLALGRLTATESQRVTAFLVATLAAGVDWLAWILERSGAAWAHQFATPFAVYWNWNVTGTLALPLWAAGQAALLLLLALLVDQMERPARWRAVVLLACGPACWALHPYTGLAAFALAAALPLVGPVACLLRAERPDWGLAAARLRVVAPVLASAGLVAAEMAWASGDPVVAHASAQAFRFNTTVNPFFWPIVYTLPLGLAWFGWRASRAEGGPREEMLVGWMALALLLSLNPWFSGYKFQYLLAVPASALAARGLDWLRARTRLVAAACGRPLIPVAVLGIASVGTVYAPFADIPVLRSDESVLASAGELAALEHLRLQGEGAVLAPPERAALVAWKTLHPMHYGHFFLTVDEGQRRAEAERFLDPATDDAWRRELLAGSRIRWVLVPPALRDRLAETAWGRVSFESGGWRVVEVLRD